MHHKFFFILAIFGITLQTAHSQDFEVSPVLIEFDAEPGNAQSKTLLLTNHSTAKQSFTLTLSDEIFLSEGKKKYAEPGTTENSCAKWLTIFPTYFSLNPGERQEVQLTIKVPPGQNQTKWVTIFAKTAKERTAEGADKSMNTGVVVNPRIAIKIFQSPSSNTAYSASMINAEYKSVDAGKASYNLYIQNNGQKIIRPRISAVIVNLATGAETNVDELNSFVLPGITREVLFTLPELNPGEYSVIFMMDYYEKADIEGREVILNIP